MDIERIRFMEHLAVTLQLPLEEFCTVFRNALDLPTFTFDAENESEWGLVEKSGIEYNVSKPFEQDTLQDWDNSVPEGANFGISLIVSSDCPKSANAEWGNSELVPHVAQRLANALRADVHHHRTWLGIGENVRRKRVFSFHSDGHEKL